MTGQELVNKYLAGAEKGKAGPLSIHGDSLYSYGTPLCHRLAEDVYAVNIQHYSVTTEKHRKLVTRSIPRLSMVCLHPHSDTPLDSRWDTMVKVLEEKLPQYKLALINAEYAEERRMAQSNVTTTEQNLEVLRLWEARIKEKESVV